MNPPISVNMLDQIHDALYRGQKIQAIKLHREATGSGLAESKTAVEAIEEQLRAAAPEKFSTKPAGAGCLPLLLLVGACVLFSIPVGSDAVAQTISTPPNPNQFSKRTLGGNGGNGSVGVSTGGSTESKTIIITYVAVTPERAWKNAEGKIMQARLLAFSAPAEGEKGPVEVIREGMVRFLLSGGKDPIDYPITKLSQSDQIDIKAIAQAAKRGAPNASDDAAESTEPSKEAGGDADK